jgi:hypothetical protein
VQAEEASETVTADVVLDRDPLAPGFGHAAHHVCLRESFNDPFDVRLERQTMLHVALYHRGFGGARECSPHLEWELELLAGVGDALSDARAVDARRRIEKRLARVREWQRDQAGTGDPAAQERHRDARAEPAVWTHQAPRRKREAVVLVDQPQPRRVVEDRALRRSLAEIKPRSVGHRIDGAHAARGL